MLDSFSTALRQMELADKIFFGDRISNRSLYYPTVDIFEKDNEWLIFAELPGIKKDDISIKIENSILKLSAKREEIKVSDDSKYKVREMQYGNFERNIRLSNDLDIENIDASLENGILQVKIPKKRKKVKEIEIKIQ